MDHLYKINCLPSPNSLFKLRTGSNIFFFKLHETFNIKLFSLKRNRIDKQLYLNKTDDAILKYLNLYTFSSVDCEKGKKTPLFKGIYVALRERQNISMNMNKIICNTEKVSTITSKSSCKFSKRRAYWCHDYLNMSTVRGLALNLQ